MNFWNADLRRWGDWVMGRVGDGESGRWGEWEMGRKVDEGIFFECGYSLFSSLMFFRISLQMGLDRY